MRTPRPGPVSLLEQLQATLGSTYDVERELGGGGMSRVFLATDRELRRKVVIKVLMPELTHGVSAERFRREILLAARLQHPHLVQLLSAGVAEGVPFYVMPFVEGESLRDRLARDGEAPVTDAVRTLREVASALLYAHEEGVVHRDVKPDNVLLSHGIAMLTDLGVAKAIADAADGDARMTATGVGIGTPAYMAPEQATADPQVDHRADIYAWGVLAYELLTGEAPFNARTAQGLIAAHVTQTPIELQLRRPAVPEGIAALVMRCLEKRPADRPQSFDEILRQLDASVTPPDLRAGRVSGRQRNRTRTLIAVGAATLIVAGGAFAARRYMSASPGAASGRQTVAVLPFTSVGGDSSHDYFADGMTDELADALANVPGLQIAGRRSVYAFKGKTTELRQIGAALGVSLLLDGSVRRDGDRVRVNAQLSKASDGLAIWNAKYEGTTRDVFALQDSIARAVVSALRLRLGVNEARNAATRTANAEAHDLYLQAHAIAERHTATTLTRAIALFQEAIKADSTYVAPWIGLADAYGWQADQFSTPAESYPKAKSAALRAIQLDSLSADAHAVLAWDLYAYDFDPYAAEREGRRAVMLDSSSALAHSNYAFVLMVLDRPAEAIAEARRAMALEPMSASMATNLEWQFLMARQYDSVLAQHERTRRIDAGYFFGDSFVGAALRELGRYPEALRAYDEAQVLAPDMVLTGRGVTYARMHDTASALRVARSAEAAMSRDNIRAPGIAAIYANLGDARRAMEWLDRAYKARSHQMMWMRRDPAFDALRADSGFTALMNKLWAKGRQ